MWTRNLVVGFGEGGGIELNVPIAVLARAGDEVWHVSFRVSLQFMRTVQHHQNI